ncbi:hypothetical protein WN944_018547 [Citrus x changshan-huyou]|uniref:Uncharacterized protein n=1 Tax=Citrus x changshan-huyou TaxID=2935761 RepID=A0AAP0LUL3_9ROSI
MPANEHDDTSPENVKSCSLLLDKAAASSSKGSAGFTQVLAAEACSC